MNSEARKVYRSFKEFPVWQLSLKVSKEVFKITKELPRSEDYGLTSQIRRSANSISANIAEAFGREHSKEKQHFYQISRGSAYELESHLLYGEEVEYFPKDKIKEINIEIGQLIFELNKIIKTLRNYSSNK